MNTIYVILDRWIDDDTSLIFLAVGLNLDGAIISVEARDEMEDRWVDLPDDVAAQLDMEELAVEAKKAGGF